MIKSPIVYTAFLGRLKVDVTDNFICTFYEQTETDFTNTLKMERAAVRTALVRIGFLEAAALAIVEEQGIDSLEEIRLLSDDEISNLGKLLRRPGGTVPGAAGVAGPLIPNPGIQVNARAETNMKLLAFYLRHQVRSAGPFNLRT
jgi:hypothetical protein